jgi:1,2-diacylglycerol 3-beta-galactosyltransferase
LILMAHTGGGHLRASEAVAEALHRLHGIAVKTEILDAVGIFGPFPFNRLDRIYRYWVRFASPTWGWSYRATDDQRKAYAVLRLFWPVVWPRAQRMLERHAADIIVSAHPLTNHYTAWALQRLGRSIPLVTLVTDPISVHPFWFCSAVDRCLVASAAAREKALACEVRGDQVHVTGHPVNPVFSDGLLEKAQARRALGWPIDRLIVLLLGGGEGVGSLYRTACELEIACPDIQLAVVAGRNSRLKQRLEKRAWSVPVRVFGFVQHAELMAQLMSAADVLITKAGPGTIHEAFLAGLPLVLNAAVPGQEEGNVRLVVEGGAGEWAPGPIQAAQAIARWTQSDDGGLGRKAACAKALAQPNAAYAVAREIWPLALTKL